MKRDEFLVKINENDVTMSAEELCAILKDGNSSIINSLLHFGSNIRGTSKWKYAKRQELKDMIEF